LTDFIRYDKGGRDGKDGEDEIEGRTLVSMFGEDCMLTSWPEPHCTVASSARGIEIDHRDNHGIHPEGRKGGSVSRGCLCLLKRCGGASWVHV